MLHRARDLLMRQRTQLINALRAHLAEFGITAAQGREGIKELLAIIAQDEGTCLPVRALTCSHEAHVGPGHRLRCQQGTKCQILSTSRFPIRIRRLTSYRAAV